ncbi:hypothetical protein ACQ4M4_27555 [Leptolyngbya sp. AN02str]|uniref:hypothetical protein n=1 Tax=Leptolyngbya sp. AN02str TaxID=3423363 RepID=UPI003D311466
MELFKFALGPYEFFASILGGIPLVLVIFFIYSPNANFQDLLIVIQQDFSFQVIVVFAFFSYFLGSLVQDFTWKYFLFLCKTFHQNFDYFQKNELSRRYQALQESSMTLATPTLDFEDKLVLLLHDAVGIPTKINWLYLRLQAYLKERNRPAVIAADLYQASHIMYRNISFGLLLLGLVLLINLLRIRLFSWAQFTIALASIGFAYIAFLRAVTFKKWFSREVLYGFYFAVTNTQSHPELKE